MKARAGDLLMAALALGSILLFAALVIWGLEADARDTPRDEFPGDLVGPPIYPQVANDDQ